MCQSNKITDIMNDAAGQSHFETTERAENICGEGILKATAEKLLIDQQSFCSLRPTFGPTCSPTGRGNCPEKVGLI